MKVVGGWGRGSYPSSCLGNSLHGVCVRLRLIFPYFLSFKKYYVSPSSDRPSTRGLREPLTKDTRTTSDITNWLPEDSVKVLLRYPTYSWNRVPTNRYRYYRPEPLPGLHLLFLLFTDSPFPTWTLFLSLVSSSSPPFRGQKTFIVPVAVNRVESHNSR